MIYSASGTIAVAATKTPLILGSTAAIRPRILAYDVYTDGTPTSDQGIVWQIQRATALGTSTAYTPTPTDPSDPASVFTAGVNATIEPTYTAAQVLYKRATNPRASWQWAAYDQRSEIIMPAVASNGVGFQIQTAGGAAGNFGVNATLLE
jgi:hypothetical protein